VRNWNAVSNMESCLPYMSKAFSGMSMPEFSSSVTSKGPFVNSTGFERIFRVPVYVHATLTASNQNDGLRCLSMCPVVQMCILAGCDFVSSMPGIGIKKAHAGIKRYRQFVAVIKNARMNNTSVAHDYEVDVQRAYWTFRHQRCAYLASACCPLRRRSWLQIKRVVRCALCGFISAFCCML
jgi:hypothetical protein